MIYFPLTSGIEPVLTSPAGATYINENMISFIVKNVAHP